MEEISCCPIENTLSYIGKKWTMEIIRDLFRGKARFKEFIEANPSISTKMLSLRLKDLEKNGIITKNIVETSPLLIEYKLTEKGKQLKPILYELAAFSIRHCPEILKKKGSKEKCLQHLNEHFGQK